jgi:hypothetical protein
LSSHAELVIYLAVLAALWVGYVVRKVRRERDRPPGLGTPAPYEDNLAIVPVSEHRGRFGGHGGHVSHEGHVSHGGHGSGFGGHDAGAGLHH